VSRKRKAKRRLEQSRGRGLLKQQRKLAKAEAALLARELALATQQHQDAMIELYRDANVTQRAVLEVEYQKVAGSSLKRAFEARIIASLAKSAARRL
jgi:hypothetical protein